MRLAYLRLLVVVVAAIWPLTANAWLIDDLFDFLFSDDVDNGQCMPASPSYADRKPNLSMISVLFLLGRIIARRAMIDMEVLARSLLLSDNKPIYMSELISTQFLYSGSWTNWDKDESTTDVLRKLTLTLTILSKHNVHETYLSGDKIFGSTTATTTSSGSGGRRHLTSSCASETLTSRTADGTCNDQDEMWMGAAGTRYYRNLPNGATFPPPTTTTKNDDDQDDMMMTPNPRKISTQLLSRRQDGAAPPTADFINILAVGWIQFMTHDWFAHANEVSLANAFQVPIPDDDDDPLFGTIDYLTVPRTTPDPIRTEREEGMSPTFRNKVTHWWDGSQIYGSDAATQARLRSYSDGKLAMVAGAATTGGKTSWLLPERNGRSDSGFTENWWLGLEVMHTLFVLEHNAICDMLKARYSTWEDQKLFDVSRLINAAVMAKIHTVEWTPAILPNPYLEVTMNRNWNGINNITRYPPPRIFNSLSLEADVLLDGFVGNSRYMAGHPYAMTEEFVAVYRFHQLLPETLTVVTDVTANENNIQVATGQTLNGQARSLVSEHGMPTLLQSLGRQNPTAFVLHNYPKFLQDLESPHGIMDLGTIDILRDRERGIPRYNEFRRLVALKPIPSFRELTGGDEVLAQEIADIYDNDIEMVDLHVGMAAEGVRPHCYGFGETNFQIFIAMASYRLSKDRFYTDDYRADIYTQEGLDWVEHATLKAVILRHFPDLKDDAGLASVANAFASWKP